MVGNQCSRIRAVRPWGVAPLAIALTAALASACAGQGGVLERVPVRPGIEVLLTDSTALWQGKRLGLVTNLAAVDREGVGVIERLRAAGGNLVALFGPEHGLTVTAAPGEAVASSTDSATRIPIHSLYGATRVPTPAMLAGIDLLLVDLPDVGARYYTYLATTIDVMRAAAQHRIPVVVLDRPNPIGGRAMAGNILDTLYRSSIGILAMPMRTGLTLAEGARLARQDMQIPVDLRIVPAAGWQRSLDQDATGLPFRAPSPNLRDLASLYHYPGTCLFEGTALSVGRGTDAPFHQIGAPWLDTTAVLSRMRALALPGVRFEGVRFTPQEPGDGKWNGTSVHGIRLILTDADRYDAVATAVHLLAAIRARHPDQLGFTAQFERLAGGPGLRQAIERGEDGARILASWEAGIAAFRARVAPLLLYP